MTNKLRPNIEFDGQPYVDDQIYDVFKPKPEYVSDIAMSIAKMFGSCTPEKIVETIGHERIRLRWMKADGKGGLVQK